MHKNPCEFHIRINLQMNNLVEIHPALLELHINKPKVPNADTPPWTNHRIGQAYFQRSESNNLSASEITEGRYLDKLPLVPKDTLDKKCGWLLWISRIII